MRRADTDSMDAASQAVQAETEAQLLQLGASLPSDNHRRLAQTMFLARKVVTQQREVTDLKQTSAPSSLCTSLPRFRTLSVCFLRFRPFFLSGERWDSVPDESLGG